MQINELRCFVLRSIAWATVLAFSATPCNASRVYQFVEYPTYQNSHKFAGTLTTTDDAPLDSVLDKVEILDWHISIADQRTLNVSRNYYPLDFTEVRGVRISNSAVELPAAMDSSAPTGRLLLSESTEGGQRGAHDYRVLWSTQFDASQGSRLIYGASALDGDAIYGYWFNNFSAAGGATWLIATAVPEPSMFVIVAICAAPVLRFRRC